MDSGVGASLREARKRRHLDLAEVEAAIKIRVRFLRAIEDEDWDILPGGAYTRGFIRTYGAYLGLDGERLAEEHRQAASQGGERATRRAEPIVVGSPVRERRGVSGRVLTALVTLALAALLVAVGLAGDEDSEAPAPQRSTAGERQRLAAEDGRSGVAARPGVSLGLVASAEVWVCLVDGDGRPLLDGEILEPGGEAGPFRSERFAVAFGKGAVELTIDGDPKSTAPSSGPVGYEIAPDGGLIPLEEGQRPVCE